MIGLTVISACAVLQEIEEEKAFRAMCGTLPEDEANKLIKRRAEKREKEAEHRRVLEIANAGRARNFWGN